MLLVVNDGKLKERETREQRDRYNRLTFGVDVMNNMGKDWRKAELAFETKTPRKDASRKHITPWAVFRDRKVEEWRAEGRRLALPIFT